MTEGWIQFNILLIYKVGNRRVLLNYMNDIPSLYQDLSLPTLRKAIAYVFLATPHLLILVLVEGSILLHTLIVYQPLLLLTDLVFSFLP